MIELSKSIQVGSLEILYASSQYPMRTWNIEYDMRQSPPQNNSLNRIAQTITKRIVSSYGELISSSQCDMNKSRLHKIKMSDDCTAIVVSTLHFLSHVVYEPLKIKNT